MEADLKQKLEKALRQKIKVRIGTSENYGYDIKDDKKSVDIAVYLHSEENIAIIWDIKFRRAMGGTAHCLELKKEKIDLHRVKEGYIDTIERKFNTEAGMCSESIIIMSFETLVENIWNLPEMLLSNLQPLNESSDKINSNLERGRRTVSSWNRDRRFRNKIFERYGGKCAICRCNEEKLLEACHIIAVSDGGSDEETNGICLCANHHKMLDAGLVEIDFDHSELQYISDSVKSMPWYSVFIEQYNGKIIIRGEDDA